MKPYKIVAETDEYIVHEFRTWYFYVLYAIVIILLVGVLEKIAWLSSAGMISMLLYFVFVTLPYLPLHRRIRKAMRDDKVEFSGSKWSFRHPLKVKMKSGDQKTV